VTDPDKSNIRDQRYPSDAELRYQVGSSRPRTQAQWLDYFTEQYGKYEILPPSAPGGQWHATALFGQRDSYTAGPPPNCWMS
jgi:hypothetical protein